MRRGCDALGDLKEGSEKALGVLALDAAEQEDLSLIHISTLDRKKSEEFAKKALLGDGFTLEDFRDQLRQIKKLGSMESILKMLPSVGPFAGLQQASKSVDEKQFVRLEAIINSMTPLERRNHEIISGSRRKRIAKGLSLIHI